MLSSEHLLEIARAHRSSPYRRALHVLESPLNLLYLDLHRSQLRVLALQLQRVLDRTVALRDHHRGQMRLVKYHSLEGAFFLRVARFGASTTTFFSGIATGGCELGMR